MFKKIIYHLIIVVVLSLTIKWVVDRIEDKNPIIKAISEIRFSDLYFSINNNLKPSSEIFIIDIGDKDPLKSREEIANFIEEINSKYKPKIIGVDVYFNSKYKDAAINSKLISALSNENVIKMFKIDQTKGKDNKYQIYADYSVLPALGKDSIFSREGQDGYTFGLGDPSDHTCVRYFKPVLELQVQKNKNNVKYHHFSKLIAKKYLEKSDKKFSSNINFDHKMMINYNIDFSKNRIDIGDSTRYNELKDKIVLIGVNTYKNGKPHYNDDVHFTPRNKNYIGRSEKDCYGIEILGTIVSNLINPNDALSYSPNFVYWLNKILFLIIYIGILYLFITLNESFIFFKILSQTLGVLFLVLISIASIYYTKNYIDLSFSILMMFISAELVEVIEELLQRLPNYHKKLSQKFPIFFTKITKVSQNLSKSKATND